jgi:hypothetical protein
MQTLILKGLKMNAEFVAQKNAKQQIVVTVKQTKLSALNGIKILRKERKQQAHQTQQT